MATPGATADTPAVICPRPSLRASDVQRAALRRSPAEPLANGGPLATLTVDVRHSKPAAPPKAAAVLGLDLTAHSQSSRLTRSASSITWSATSTRIPILVEPALHAPAALPWAIARRASVLFGAPAPGAPAPPVAAAMCLDKLVPHLAARFGPTPPPSHAGCLSSSLT